MIAVTVDNAIRLNVAELQVTHRPFLQAVKADLVFDNPEYISLVRLGKKAWNVPPKLKLYEFDPQTKDLVLPRGYFEAFNRLRSEHDVPLDFVYQEVFETSAPGKWGLWSTVSVQLRPYQFEAVQAAYRERNGVIVAPTGSGKTVIGLAIIACKMRKALWLTHTKDLAQQTMRAAEQWLGCDCNELGFVGDGMYQIGTHLTVGLVQTLSQRPIPEWPGLADVGVLVLDEAHHVPAETFQRVVATSPAAMRIGLTATPERADGLHPIMYAVIGPVIATVTNEELVETGQILRPTVYRVATGCKPPWPPKRRPLATASRAEKATARKEEEERYARLVEALVRDKARNELIASLVREEWRAGHSCLVLSTRINHLYKLADAIQEIGLRYMLCSDPPEVAVLTSKVPGPERTEIIARARERKVRILLATQLGDEGLDIPALDRLFLAMPKRAAPRAVQQIGRILRPAPDKKDAIVYDFVDDAGVLVSQWRSRRHAYLEHGFEVRELPSRPAMPAAAQNKEGEPA